MSWCMPLRVQQRPAPMQVLSHRHDCLPLACCKLCALALHNRVPEDAT